MATTLELPSEWAAVPAVLGATLAASLASLIGSYALSWRSALAGVASGAALGVLPEPEWGRWGGVAGCWAAAIITSLLVSREPPLVAQRRTSPRLVSLLHVLQTPLILLSLAASFASARPRPFVVGFVLAAFALWRLTDGKCPLSRAEVRLRALRGETAATLDEIGFIGYQVQRVTGFVLPKGAISRFSYVTAALTFAWYAFQALR